MQTLATRNADGVRLDFGLTLQFDKTGMRAIGRSDNPDYIGALFVGLTKADITPSLVADDYQIPSPPQAQPWSALWANKGTIPPHQFPAIVQGAGINYGRIADDMNGSFVRDIILAPSMKEIDPNDIGIAPDGRPGVFRWIVRILKSTNAADGQPLLSDAGEVAIAALWPKRAN